MKSKVSFLVVLGVVSVLLLAACAPAISGAANSGNAVPVTAATDTPAAVNSSGTNASAAGSSSASSASPTAPASGVSSAGASGSGVTYTLVPENSQASYKVREQLAKFNFPTDAVGKTNAITGSITIHPDGTIDTSSSMFTVDLSTLQTDSNMRDNFVRRNVLETNQFPQAVFVPTQVSGLPAAIPQSGSVSFKVTGNMTIHGVTKPVTWDVTGTVNNGEASGQATTSFTFEDFGIRQPQVPVVLSLVDKITLNVNVDLKKN